MIRAGAGTIAACLLVIASACGSGGSELGMPQGPSGVPSPGPPSPPAPIPVGRQITVGEEVTDTLTDHGTDRLYQLTAPSDGTLIVRLSWDPNRGSLELRLADIRFASRPPDRSPIIAKLPVAAGQTYSVWVMDAAPWEYDELSLSFVVTTSITR
jgi:hypothetical protein